MSRTLNSATVASLMAAQTTDVFLVLLRIGVPDSSPMTYYYLADNTENITYAGQAYTAFPFSLQLPTDESGQITSAQVTIDNVTRNFIDDVRNNTDALKIDMYIVNASNSPVSLEASFTDFYLKQITYDEISISGTLSVEEYMTEPFPKDTISASKFPGLF